MQPKNVYAVFLAIIIVWIGAWILKVNLEPAVSWLTAGWGSFILDCGEAFNLDSTGAVAS